MAVNAAPCRVWLWSLTAVNGAVVFSWEAIFPLFAFTSPSLGGLGLSVSAGEGQWSAWLCS
jgi:hypothetical protein